jgi:hypothetical protein
MGETGNEPTDGWLTLREIAAHLRVSVEVVRQWCIRHEQGLLGGLPSTHVGTRNGGDARQKLRRVSRADLDRFIESRRNPGPAAPPPAAGQNLGPIIPYAGTRRRHKGSDGILDYV